MISPVVLYIMFIIILAIRKRMIRRRNNDNIQTIINMQNNNMDFLNEPVEEPPVINEYIETISVSDIDNNIFKKLERELTDNKIERDLFYYIRII